MAKNFIYINNEPYYGYFNGSDVVHWLVPKYTIQKPEDPNFVILNPVVDVIPVVVIPPTEIYTGPPPPPIPVINTGPKEPLIEKES